MIQPKIAPNAIEDEVKALKDVDKQEYIDFKEIGDEGDAPDFETEDEFHAQAQAQAQAVEASSRYRKTGKLLFQITDVAIPRVGAMFTGQSHKELQAKPDDREDIIEAYEAFCEAHDYDFDSPALQLITVLFFVYGINIIDGMAKKPRKVAPRPVTEPAPVAHAEQQDVDDEPEPAPVGVKKTTEDGVIAEFPTCTASDCAKILKPGQVKFCSNECRMKGLNDTKPVKKKKDE